MTTDRERACHRRYQSGVRLICSADDPSAAAYKRELIVLDRALKTLFRRLCILQRALTEGRPNVETIKALPTFMQIKRYSFESADRGQYQPLQTLLMGRGIPNAPLECTRSSELETSNGKSAMIQCYAAPACSSQHA